MGRRRKRKVKKLLPKYQNPFLFVPPHMEDGLVYQMLCEDDFSCCDCDEEPTVEDVEESIFLIEDFIDDAIRRGDKEEVASLRRTLNAMKVLRREVMTA